MDEKQLLDILIEDAKINRFNANLYTRVDLTEKDRLCIKLAHIILINLVESITEVLDTDDSWYVSLKETIKFLEDILDNKVF